jgi:hypothetical protein
MDPERFLDLALILKGGHGTPENDMTSAANIRTRRGSSRRLGPAWETNPARV